MCSVFLPGLVQEREGDRHPRRRPRHSPTVGDRTGGLHLSLDPVLPLLFLIPVLWAPPLACLLLSDQQGGPQSLPQQVAQVAGLALGVFNRLETHPASTGRRDTREDCYGQAWGGWELDRWDGGIMD